MPLYEYVCKKCHHRFEKIQKFSDRKVKKCPKCRGPVEQTITAPAVHFKGSGFYVNDYAAKSPSKDSQDHAPTTEKEPAQDAGKKSKDKSPDKSPEKSEDKSKKPAAKKDKE
jgi:putative FmdB family regulatory protein